MYQSDVNFLLNNDFVYFFIFITHYLFRHSILWDIFLYQSDASFLLNVDFAYFAYSHQSGGVTSEHWLTDILLLIFI
jgi:hypothetical protein